MTTSMIRSRKTDRVPVEATTYTTHVVDVDLASLLAGLGIGFSDTVVLAIQTPSGRAKRVTLNPSFLVEPHHVSGIDEYN